MNETATTAAAAANIFGGHYTERQCMVLMVIQRISGAISLLGGLYICQRAWKRRHCAFDRIMLGLSIQTILWSIYHLWGNAAAPIGTPGVYGAYGSDTTCAIQGFLFQTTMVVPCYYVCLSCYSWAVIVQGNFDPARYEWIEKYIHILVHVFPVGSAIFLHSIEAFNPNGLYCWIASIPAGCGVGTGIECTRGPKNPQRILLIFAGIPAIFFVAFPTALMAALVIVVYRKHKTGSIPSVITPSMVARQSALYLGSLYWVYLPIFIYYNTSKRFNNFGIAVWVSTVSVSLGLWFAIVYKYFSSSGKDPSAFSCDDSDCGGAGAVEPSELKCSSTAHRSTVITAAEEAIPEVSLHFEESESDDHFQSIDESFQPQPSSTANMNHSSGSNGLRDGSSKSSRSRKGAARWTLNRSGGGGGGPRTAAKPRCSFNIFDGTAASSGKFAAFVFDGDSEDEAKDMAETGHWESCQNMIRDS